MRFKRFRTVPCYEKHLKNIVDFGRIDRNLGSGEKRGKIQREVKA